MTRCPATRRSWGSSCSVRRCQTCSSAELASRGLSGTVSTMVRPLRNRCRAAAFASAAALAGDLGEHHPGRHRGVQRFGRTRHRDRHHGIAVLPTSRDSPLPSEPTTTTVGPDASSSSRVVSPPASRPTICNPASPRSLSVRFRLVARATGSRAAAPALVRHATAVTDADRRCGISTPCPPKAAVERTIAPRLRGRRCCPVPPAGLA